MQRKLSFYINSHPVVNMLESAGMSSLQIGHVFILYDKIFSYKLLVLS
jgi:hypothetical protein